MKQAAIINLFVLSLTAAGLLCAAVPLMSMQFFSVMSDPNSYDPNDPNEPYDPNVPDPNQPSDPNDPNSILLADINTDGIVNYLDFEVLASYWLHNDCNIPDWCGGADVDMDCFADMNDLLVMADSWLFYNGIVVPDLTGLAQADAVAAISAAGLTPGVISEEHSALIALGRVIRQTPAGGQPAEPNSLVNLIISTGPTFFYVSKQGSDLNDGSCPTQQSGSHGPFATIQKGLQVLAVRDACGDILSVRGGTYYEECTSFGGINATAMVVIENYNDEEVIIDGGEPITSWQSCGLYESKLAVNGSMPPNWNTYYTNVYKADIQSSKLYALIERPYYGVKLVYDNQLCPPCSVIDMPYAVFPDLENTGWAMTSAATNTLRDTVHLTQPDDYWNGSFVWFIGDSDNVAYAREITDFSASNDTITFDPCPAGVNATKKFWISNHPHHLNTPGEYYWEPNEVDGYYTIFYYKTPSQTLSDLNSHMKALAKSAGIRFSVSSSNLLIRGLCFQNCQTRGNLDHFGNIINGGPIGQCGFICSTNWCNSISNITIQDCTFRNFYGNEGGAIVFGECQSDITVDNCTISDVGRGAGIRFYGTSEDKTQGITVKNCTLSRIWGSNIRPYFAANVQITGNIITQFDGVHGNAVTVYGSCDNVLVAHNFVTAGTNALVMKDMNGMYIFGNVFRSTDESGSLSVWDVDYRAVTGDLFILQNTILTSSPVRKSALFFLDQNNSYLPTGASVIVKNNIIDGFEYASDWNNVVTHTYNLYLEASSHQRGTCAACSAWLYGNSEIVNLHGHLTEFVDYLSENYMLSVTSNAVHTGCVLSPELSVIKNVFPYYNCQTDMAGIPWNIPPSMGAYERSSP